LLGKKGIKMVKKELHSYTVRLAAPESEASVKFIQGMLNRMAVSFHKYGPVKDGFPDKINARDSLRQRMEQYVLTGNTEFLIDAANFAMIEFMFPAHPGAFFEATDSDKSPGRVFTDGTISSGRN
jgi:hypothetical protein